MTVSAPFVFQPVNVVERALVAVQGWPGYFGRSARRKLLRRTGKRSIAAFDRICAGLTAGDAVLDLGANVGVFTARLAATGAVVHAYEPDPDAFSELSLRVAGLANVRLYNAAVAAEAGTLRLRRQKLRGGAGHNTVASSLLFGNGDPAGVEVEVVSFAQALARCGGRVALVKMDIEGAEFDILERVFADPAAFDFGAMFVETHERLEPAKTALIDRLRLQAGSLRSHYINLYWP